jgi:hypothetical protein
MRERSISTSSTIALPATPHRRTGRRMVDCSRVQPAPRTTSSVFSQNAIAPAFGRSSVPDPTHFVIAFVVRLDSAFLRFWQGYGSADRHRPPRLIRPAYLVVQDVEPATQVKGVCFKAVARGNAATDKPQCCSSLPRRRLRCASSREHLCSDWLLTRNDQSGLLRAMQTPILRWPSLGQWTL